MNSALNLPSPSPAMNPFIQPDYLPAVHARLGLLLTSRQHILLRAQEPVDDETKPAAEPKSAVRTVPTGTKQRPSRAKGNRDSSNCDRVLRVLTNEPKSAKDIAEECALPVAVVRTAICHLISEKRITNRLKGGGPGAYTLPKFTSFARGPFDV